MITIQTAHALTEYLRYVFIDADWKNDWLTHLPMTMRGGVKVIGKIIAASVFTFVGYHTR